MNETKPILSSLMLLVIFINKYL